MAARDQPGRRSYDETAATVVPLRDHLEDKIKASHDELRIEIRNVSATLTEVKAHASREHAEVRAEIAGARADIASELSDLRTSVNEIRIGQAKSDTAMSVSLKTAAKIGGAAVTVMTLAFLTAGLVLKVVLGV